MTPDTAPDAQMRCEGCGQRVSVYSDREGTNSYVGEAEIECAALRLENERLRRTVLRFERALEEIVKHQQMIAGTMNARSTVTMIAKAALQQAEGEK